VPQGAWEFIKFWSGLKDPNQAAELYTWGGWLPLSKAVAGAPAYRAYVRKHPQFQTFLDVLPSQNIQPTPPVPYQDYLWDRVTRADDSAMRGTLTPQEALQRLVHEIEIEQAKRKELRLGE
jgi:multiple sugar transport system substrate-binding protein